MTERYIVDSEGNRTGVVLDVAEYAALLRRSHHDLATGTGAPPKVNADFFAPDLTLDRLAEAQGVPAVPDISVLVADFWPDDETADDFLASLRTWRREGQE